MERKQKCTHRSTGVIYSSKPNQNLQKIKGHAGCLETQKEAHEDARSLFAVCSGNIVKRNIYKNIFDVVEPTLSYSTHRESVNI